MFSDFLPDSFSHYGDTVTPINQGQHVCYMKSCRHSHGDLEIIANELHSPPQSTLNPQTTSLAQWPYCPPSPYWTHLSLLACFPGRMLSSQSQYLNCSVPEAWDFLARRFGEGLWHVTAVLSPHRLVASRDPLHMQMFTQSALAPAGLHLQPCKAGASTMSPGFLPE